LEHLRLKIDCTLVLVPVESEFDAVPVEMSVYGIAKANRVVHASLFPLFAFVVVVEVPGCYLLPASAW
jgi:hypothetical protein